MLKIIDEKIKDTMDRCAVTPDGRFLVGLKDPDRTFRTFDLSQGEYPAGRVKLTNLEASLFGSLGDRNGLAAVNSDGFVFVSDESDPVPNVTVIGMHTGRLVKTLDGFTASPSSLSLSDNREFILICEGGSVITKWNARSLEFTGSAVKAQGGEFNVIGYRESEDLLILNHVFGGYETYGMERRRRISSFRRSEAVPEKFIAFLGGGSEILSKSGKELCVFSLDGRISKRLQGHTDIITGCNANAVCGLAATSQWTGTRDIFLWDLQSGDLIGRLTGHTGEVRAIIVTNDAKLIVSGGADKTVRLWDVKREALLGEKTLDRPVIRLTPILDNGFFYAVMEGSEAVLMKLCLDKP